MNTRLISAMLPLDARPHFTQMIYLLSWQNTGGDIDPIGAFSTRDKAIIASRALAIEFVLWQENTSCTTVLPDGRDGRFWLTDMPLDKELTMEDV